MTVRAPRIFLSYAREDEKVVLRFVDDLVKSGAKVYVDVKDVKVGDSITSFIETSLAASDVFCILLSENSKQSPWVGREYRTATYLQLSKKGKKLRIVPIRLDDSDVPVLLNDIRYADARYDYQAALNSILEAAGLPVVPAPFTEIVGSLSEREINSMFARFGEEEGLTTRNLCEDVYAAVTKGVDRAIEEIGALNRGTLKSVYLDHVNPPTIVAGRTTQILFTYPASMTRYYVDGPIADYAFDGIPDLLLWCRRHLDQVRARNLYVLPPILRWYARDYRKRDSGLHIERQLDINDVLGFSSRESRKI